MISSCFFLFFFFKFWFFGLLEGEGGGGGGLEGKRHKVAQNENYKLHLSHFLVHIQEFSSFFKNSGFLGFYGEVGEGRGVMGCKRAKMTHNYQFQSVTLCHTHIVSGILDHIIKIYGIQV